VRLLDTNPPPPSPPPPPGSRPHLNGASLGVEVGGPQTLGGKGVGGATPTAATAAIVVVAVILCFVGLLQLMFLRVLLLLLVSWPAFLPAGGGRRRWRLLCGVEGGGG
jgi:hypothetical protein